MDKPFTITFERHIEKLCGILATREGKVIDKYCCGKCSSEYIVMVLLRWNKDIIREVAKTHTLTS